MHKFFVAKNSIIDDKAYIEGDDLKHIYKVLRLQEGEKVSINNCEGEEFLGVIEKVDKKEAIVKIIEKLETNNESNIEIYLFQGLPKSSKMDLIVQKATELGVKEITPIITERVIVKNEIGEFKKIDRYIRIALEACKQSKRSVIPEVKNPLEFDRLLTKLKEMDLILVPYENEEGYGIKNVVKDIAQKDIKKIGIIIGPEGGFEENEINILKELGAYIITLGPRILRTETAGFVCTSLIMYELGDLGGQSPKLGFNEQLASRSE
ncbi:16S rRNA (uracil(1498)-N(3))-methyltransferase [Clostridiaceae bacterium UIB06]|uniref:Ribosomal RNA small subunit methyltransferase E n=1 Tax=Clostridium thailandense TaxID=2794346 RepID=A0A949TYT4_9CLOT|nr:16S rRNA (uracil(1498)-N(3))-methyltransferase [Clostridium thailandense]MBV7273029.1 16S rRNA (uracil(1498)-N(3))-methyltransferase [Clostridium thailandense]MCH5135693.1 16S rRNA (uracil(1498)-N(3))-methyltransferase [Clostridiaceae bacterium UIB06]